ncbi:unnamed protein product [Linum trigynum]|uniref:Uncharacterized protein n=1 Tax=Linum trigynum TaxID=586398 RepID=A0AAV2EA26_9ROSI
MQHQQQQKEEQIRTLVVQLSQRRGELEKIKTTITILQTQTKSTAQPQTILQQQTNQLPPTKWADMVEEDEKNEEDERK